MTEEVNIKEAITELGQTFAEFKKTNDQKIANLEAGVSDPLLDEKMSSIESKLDSFEDINQKLTQQQQAQENIKEQIDHLDTVLRRPNSGFDTKQIDETISAFDSYCRKGIEGISPDEKKALTVSNDATGGYLAPPEYVREIIKKVTEMSPIRSIARVRSTTQRSIQMPSRTGTFSAQWVSEVGTRSESTGLTYGMEEIAAHELYALVDISEQDVEDPVFDMEAELSSEFATQFAKAEGTSFVSGTANGQPEGFLTNGSIGSTNSGAGTLQITLP